MKLTSDLCGGLQVIRSLKSQVVKSGKTILVDPLAAPIFSEMQSIEDPVDVSKVSGV